MHFCDHIYFSFPHSLSKVKERVTIDTIRPLPVFLGITGPSLCFAPDAFKPPSKKFDKNTVEKVNQRLTLNFNYFTSNYAMIFAGTCVIVTLMHPGMIIYSALVYFLWQGHKAMIENRTTLVLMEKDICDYLTVERREKVLYIFTAWVVIAKCFQPFLLVVTLTGVLVLFHAFMRDPKHIEVGRIHHGDDDGNSSDEADSCESAVVVEKGDAV